MKKHELQEIIRQVINELTQQTTIDFKDKNKGDKILDIDTSDTSTINKIKTDPNVASATMGTKKLKEDNIDEMANVGIKYVVSPNLDLSKYPGKYGRILTALQNHGEPVTKIELVDIMGLKRQQQINTEFMQLVDLGAIVQADTEFQKAKRILNPQISQPGEEPKTTEPEEETGVVSGDLSDEEIDAMFAKAKASGEEEPTPEEKPSVTTTISTAKSKAVDFFMDNKNDRLLTKLINTSAASKLRVKEADEPGGIRAGDFNRAEKARKVKAQSELDELILQMADRIKAEEDPEVQQEILGMLAKKLGSVGENILYKKIAKAVGVQAITPSSKEDEDVLDRLKDEEEGLDEWLKNKWQYYAGIIK